jgi:O-antigen ligase
MEFVVAGCIFVLAMVGLIRPFIGLLGLLIVMELQPGELYPQLAPFHLERIVAATLLVSFLIHGQKLRFPPPTRWFLAFYGSMILSVPLAFWRANAASTCVSFLETVVFILFVTALLTTEERIRWFTVTYVLLVDWLGGSALWNYAHGVWFVTMHIERANGITSSAGDPDTLAATLLFSIPLCLVLISRSNPMWMRAIGAGSIGIFLVTIVDTGSRAVAAGLVMLALLLVFRKPKNLIYLPILVALSPVIWMVIPQQYKARYETMTHLKSDDSYQNRVLSWEGGIAMFESNPVTGIGAGDYTYANGMKYWPGTGRKHWLNAHSLYFKMLGELGLVGVVAFGGYLFCVFRLNFQLQRELSALKASQFLQQLLPMSNIIFILLLFDGYAAHNLYRDTWYVIGAMIASMSLLPMLQTQSSLVELGEGSAEVTQATIDQWSPALLPVLRRQAPSEGPRT